MRIRQASALTLVLALAVAGTGCQAKVSDAAGDGGGGPDLVEATVDYTTARTTLTVRYADAASEDLVVTNYWQISTDGDTEPELDAFIGFPGQGGPDRWVVRGYAGSSPDICKSFVNDRGYDGDRTVTLSFDSRCLLIDPSKPLPRSLRILANVQGTQSAYIDATGWSPAAPRS